MIPADSPLRNHPALTDECVPVTYHYVEPRGRMQAVPHSGFSGAKIRTRGLRRWARSRPLLGRQLRPC